MHPVDINDSNAYNDSMATLNIRKLPDEIRDKLRVRAARAGRSMEAEARAILKAVFQEEAEVVSAQGLQEIVGELYGKHKPESVFEDLIAERRKEAARE